MEHHEGEASEETEGPTKLCQEGLKGVNLHLERSSTAGQDRGSTLARLTESLGLQ